MGGFGFAVRQIYDRVWGEAPWVRAAGLVSVASAALAFLNLRLPSELSIDFSDPQISSLLVAIVASVYFFLVAVLSGDQTRLQKKLRDQEQSFRYDKRGTLYNGTEPNIAFRVATFKGILEGIASDVGAEEVARAMVNTGRRSAEDFAKNLPSIYKNDLARFKNFKPWDDLSFDDKLEKWSDYDSATGWGILAPRLVNGHIRVSVTHFRKLYEGEGGTLFGSYLAGYSETVLSHILNGHKLGKYGEYTKAKLKETVTKDDNIVEFAYELL